MYHTLKTWPEPFEASYQGVKTFEVRVNDRNYQVGDHLELMEWEPDTKRYTGRRCIGVVAYILHGGQFGLPEGLCVMELKDLLPAPPKYNPNND